MTEALFARDGARFVPTILAQGPWDPHALHGGPVAALFASAIEAMPSLAPLRIARLTIDITRPVPMAPLDVDVEVRRDGKKVQLADAAISHDGTVVARCRALRIGLNDTSELRDSPYRPDTSPPARKPADGTPLWTSEQVGMLSGFMRAVDASRVVGEMQKGSPAVTWFRLNVPLIAGEITSPAAQLCALADFTSGTANYIDFMTHTSINADLTINVLREPETDWIAIDAYTVIADDGIGQSRAAIFDERGLIANTTASLVVARRPVPLSAK